MLGLLMAKLMMAAIPLTGVVGETLRTRAFFDANNVKVGDPLILTLDFIGTADFASLHPPALSKLVDRKDWKLDDASAKTETYRDARRLTYRVRPLHPGVLWFPELEFTYTDAQGGERRIRSNAIPVHVRPGVDVVVDDLPEHEVKMPQPDALMTDCDESAALDADGDFAWRKACAHPTADAFAAFDFPAAKFNEARCAILEGDWRRALSVYARLEWRVGQSPALERWSPPLPCAMQILLPNCPSGGRSVAQSFNMDGRAASRSSSVEDSLSSCCLSCLGSLCEGWPVLDLWRFLRQRPPRRRMSSTRFGRCIRK